MKKLGVLATFAFAAALVPAGFAQDQSASPSAASPSASPAAVAPQDQSTPAAAPSTAAPAQDATSAPSSTPSSAPASSMPQDQSSPAASAPPASGSTDSSAVSSSSAAEAFSGTIVKAGDKYVLKTDTKTYDLDDQSKAQQFENKQVKVNGSLDKATSVLHITDISPAS